MGKGNETLMDLDDDEVSHDLEVEQDERNQQQK